MIRHLTYLFLSFCMKSVVVSFISFILHDIGGGLFHSFCLTTVVVSFVSFILPDIGGGDKAFDSFIFYSFLPNTGSGDKACSFY